MPRTLLTYRLIVAPVKDFPANDDFVEARHRRGWESWGRRFWARRAPRTQGHGGICKPRRQRAITRYR